MGIFSTIKSWFSPKQTTTEVAPVTKGVIVTDFSSGENVVTKTTEGKVTSQSYSPAPTYYSGGGGGGGGSQPAQLGEEKALALSNRPEGLVQKNIIKEDTSAISSGALKPASTSISAVQYSGEPPERYQRPLGSALIESAGNIFNLGIIGQQGFGAYTQQITTPFEYVGQPQKYKEVGYNFNPEWRGTEFGFGMDATQKELFTPEIFKDTTNKTWFDISQQRTRDVYIKSGLSFTGEPAGLVPTRIGENVVENLKPKYTGIFESGTKEQIDYYQGEINAGRLSVSEATSQFNLASGKYADIISGQYQAEAQGIFTQRYGRVAGDIASIEAFNVKISEPPAYPIFRGIGKGIETAGIIGATALGGSGLVLATATYLGVKAGVRSVEYAQNFPEMTTGQKIIGGTGVALSWVGAYSVLNLGMNRFYNEWEGLRYSELASQPARTTGREVLRTDEFSRYDLSSLRETSTGKSVTFQRLDVYPTGEDRAGFFSKGITYTRIINPRPYGSEFIYTQEAFKTTGYIPDIKAGILSSVSGGIKSTPQDVFAGIGNAKVVTSKKISDVSFIAGSKNTDEAFKIIGGNKLSQNILDTKYFTASSNIRGSLSNAGTIYKLSEEGGASNLIVLSSGRAKSSQGFYNQLYGVGVSGGAKAGEITQKGILSNLALSSTKTSAGIIPVVAGASTLAILSPTTEAYSVIPEQVSVNRMFSSQSPSFTQSQIERTSVLNPDIFSFAGATEQSARFALAPSQSFTQASLQSSALRTGLITSGASAFNFGNAFDFGSFNPSTFNFYLPSLNLGGDLGLSSNIIRGGKRTTAYTPSFSALIFNIRGTYRGSSLSGSGLEFRPITKGFRFYKTGRNLFKI